MPTDIFSFWREIGRQDTIHPADRAIFQRLGSNGHGFNHNTLPACFMGPLRTASVVLLFMSPGYHPDDEKFARTREWQDYYVREREGYEPLPSDTPGARWWAARTKCFGVEQSTIAKHFSILNIGAYHSKEMKDPQLLAALPSSRMSLDWAQGVLFPEALAGRRVVVCMRAAKFWGLTAGQTYPGKLFAPLVTRGGYMVRGKYRDRVIQAVQDELKSLTRKV